MILYCARTNFQMSILKFNLTVMVGQLGDVISKCCFDFYTIVGVVTYIRNYIGKRCS